jgi:hypothetical protein
MKILKLEDVKTLIRQVWRQLLRTVGHPKTRAKVFGKQGDRVPVAFGILLCQVLHSFNQKLLPLDVIRP